MMRVLLCVSGVSLLLVTSACSHQSTVRTVDTKVGSGVEYGAPRDTSYFAEMDAERSFAQITVMQSSHCDIIPVDILQRYEERLHGDEVVQRNPLTKIQKAGQPKGEIPCGQSYVRNAEVFLAAGDARYSLGDTDALGQVRADLVKTFQVGAFEDVPKQMRIQVRLQRAQPLVDAGVVSLGELLRRNQRTQDLLKELEGILSKGETGASPAEISRAYELYYQLQEIAPSDPRVTGIGMRFWELYYGRKQEESREKLRKNLAVLGEAKETLKQMGDAAIPLYVQVAVSSGQMDAKSLEWASLRLIRAIKGTPAVCASGFGFNRVQGYGWPADARLSAQMLQGSYGDEYAGWMQAGCRY